MPKSQKPGGFSAAYARIADFDITTFFARAPPPKTSRSIYIQQDLPDAFYDIKKNGKRKIKKDHVYNSNQVVTSKYTVFTFVPRNLLEQFRRVANMFFLGIAILQFFPKFSTISPGLVILPLIAVLAITALKDGYEDVKRHQSDRHVNHTKTWRLAGGEWRNTNVMGPKSKTFTAGVPKALKRTKTSVIPEEFSLHEEKGSPADPATGPQHVPLPSDKPPPPLLRSPTQAQAPETYEGGPAIPHWESVIWEDVAVGDFILLHNGDPVPADLVICATSEPENIAFIETKNLDGETNLKSRHAIPELTKFSTPQNIVELTRPGPSFRIDAEAPDVTMYKLNAAVVWENGDQQPIDIQTVLLRGTVLRNTAWAVGVVMYTGGDTKIVLNSGQTPSKRSKVERQMNPMVFINLALLAAMAMVCAIVDSILEHRGANKDEYWLYNDNIPGDNPDVNGIVTFANALITFQNVVPISLYISIEFVRTCQAAFIYFDYEMYYVRPGQPPESGQPTLARSWNLSDDLGQIEYVFSDKTGTLTQNSMIFHQCSIGGKVYAGEALVDPKTRSSDSTPPVTSHSVSSGSSVQGRGAGVVDPADSVKSAQQSKVQIPHFFDNQLADDIMGASGPVQSQVVNDFFTAVALCHTVLAGKDVNGAISYKAQSPDEAALVQAAADVGYVFLGRERSTQILRLQTPHSPEPERYELLNILDFTSARKRMSVILRRLSDGQLLLICKGADQVIFKRLAPGAGELYKDKTGEDLDLFATEGLRTLCLAHKTLSEEEYIAWDARYRQAATQLQNRDEHVEIVSGEIEGNLYILGATAIEDKLQDGVPETIADLKRAGIKIWVATGDKPETAVAIGYTTNLISRQANLIFVRGGESATQRSAYSQLLAAAERFFPKSGLLENEDVLPSNTGEGLARVNTNRLARVYTGVSDIVGAGNGQRPGGFALVIDGLGLEQAFQEAYSRELLLQLAMRCEAVICCRVSPLQKALIVHLVKDGLGAMTLAIGDGANDVSMIQAADVGIGISGEEGLQAVNASDYAIGQFRYLKRLLLVHGEWSYARNANMIVNFFYKNILGIGVLWWFQIYCGWSTTYVFEYTYLLFWNVFWSLAPVIAIGIFDRNIDDVVLMALPELYNYGRRQEWFGNIIFIIYMLEGAYQSAVIFFLGVFSYMTTTSRKDGYDVYMYEFSTILGQTMVIASVMVVNAFHGISTSAWTGWVIFSISIGIVLVWIYTAVYSAIPPASFAVPVYGNDHYLFRSAYYWFGITLTFFVAMLPRYISKAYRVMYYPNDIDILRIVHKVDPHRDLEHDPLIGGRFTEDGVLRPMDVDSLEHIEPHSHPLQRRRTLRGSTPSLPAGTRTEMSTGLELAPSRGFDFSTEEGGVQMRRIQTGLSERNGEISVPTPPQKRRSIRLFPSGIRRSILKSPKALPHGPEES